MTAESPRYLRLSVTGRCDLRCVYCRPNGVEPAGEELGLRELRLLVECAAAEGVRKVRVTGGEPLRRPDLAEVVRAVASVPGIEETALTTNGMGLAPFAEALRDNGLQRVNVSLDTLRPERFRRMTGGDGPAEVIAGIEAAAGVFDEVKTNTVLLRGWNEDEVEPIARFGAERGVRARFIEYYPAEGAPAALRGVPSGEVLERLQEAFGPLEPTTSDELSIERVYALTCGGTAGLISSADAPPCRRCSRLRVDARGVLLPCLFAREGVHLKPLLRAGNRVEVRRGIRESFAAKERAGRRGRRVCSPCTVGG